MAAEQSSGAELVGPMGCGVLALRGIGAAGPDFVLAGVFLLTWVAPTTFGERAVRHFMYLMHVEFFVVHSTMLLGFIAISKRSRGLKAVLFLGSALLYLLFVGGVSMGYGSAWPLVAFYGLMAAKAPSVVFGVRQPKAKDATMRLWMVMVIAYVMGAMLTVIMPLPGLGITAEVIRAQDFSGGGVWVEQPYRIIAFGFLYFTVLGLYALGASLPRPRAGAARGDPQLP